MKPGETMPVFDYLCEECGESFEFLSLTRGETVECPSCGSQRAARQVVSRMSVRGRNQRRGRVVDLSSGACPCGGHARRHH